MTLGASACIWPRISAVCTAVTKPWLRASSGVSCGARFARWSSRICSSSAGCVTVQIWTAMRASGSPDGAGLLRWGRLAREGGGEVRQVRHGTLDAVLGGGVRVGLDHELLELRAVLRA